MPTILHVIYTSNSAKLYGAEQSLLLLIQGLSQKGYRSVVAVPHLGYLSKKLEMLDVPVVCVPTMKRWLTNIHHNSKLKRFFYNPYHIPYLFRSAIKLRKIIRTYQVNLVHTSTSVVFDGAMAAFFEKIPHIWHIRETIESGQVWSFFLGASVARRLINQFSDRIIANSEAVGNAYQNIPDVSKRVRVIYNGLNIAPYNDDVDTVALRQKLGLPATVPLIGLVGQIVPRKRPEDFLKAAAIVQQTIPDSFFLVVGSDIDASEYGRTLRNLSEQLGLADRIVWLEFCDRVYEIFEIIDLLVLPSKDEPFGRVAIEAMAARKPVVATNVGGLPEIIVDGETGFLVPPKCPQKLAEATIRILNDPQLAVTMGQAGRQRVEQYFSLDQYVNGVEAVYKELLVCADGK